MVRLRGRERERGRERGRDVKRSRYIRKREGLGGWWEKEQKSAERRRAMDRGITINKLINETKGNRMI